MNKKAYAFPAGRDVPSWVISYQIYEHLSCSEKRMAKFKNKGGAIKFDQPCVVFRFEDGSVRIDRTTSGSAIFIESLDDIFIPIINIY